MELPSKDKTIHFARNKRFNLPVAWALGGVAALIVAAIVTVVLKLHFPAPPGSSAPVHSAAAPFDAPQPAAAPAPRPALSAVAKLKPSRNPADGKKTDKRHNTHLADSQARLGVIDPLDVLAKEAGAGRYESIIEIYAELSPDAAADPAALLFRLRALYALGKTAQVAQILSASAAISDGEYYLIKAKLANSQGNIDQSLLFLDKALSVKARNLDAETLYRDCAFWRAQCLSRRFDAAPTDANRRDALDSWFEVKNSVRKNPSHEYFAKAVSEMQRIGENPVHDK